MKHHQHLVIKNRQILSKSLLIGRGEKGGRGVQIKCKWKKGFVIDSVILQNAVELNVMALLIIKNLLNEKNIFVSRRIKGERVKTKCKLNDVK